jgi:pimeloyl-ACP methyl ester carboxylesterase
MADPQEHMRDQSKREMQSPHGSTSEDPRSRLLAGLPVTERRLRLNGISTVVLEGGDGPPIVLLHGPGEYGAKWMRVIPELSTSHRVIVPDLPGHGESEAIEGPFGVERILAWLDDLIECTCQGKPTLVGQIIGGAIGARFACEHGDRLAGLVLADSLGLAGFQPTPEFGKALMDFVSDPREEKHDHFWTLCAFDLDTLRDRLGERWNWLKSYNLDRARRPDLGATQQVLMELFGMPAIPPDDLRGISVPTTLIWGRHDLATPLAVARSASKEYGWPLHVIDDAADDPPLEQPELFLEALRADLRTLSGKS